MGRGITCNVLCFIVLISLVIPKGLSQEDRCPPKAIEIVQKQIGVTVGSKTVWSVSITNTCSCSVYQLHLLCPKFKSAVVSKKDQEIISEIDSTHCLFNNGGGFVGAATTFTYAGDRVDFAVDTYQVACS